MHIWSGLTAGLRTSSASAWLVGSRAPLLGAFQREATVRAGVAAKTLAQPLTSSGGRNRAVVLEMLHHVLEVVGHPVGGVGPQLLDPLVDIVADVADRTAKRVAPEFRAGFSGQNILGDHLEDFRTERVRGGQPALDFEHGHLGDVAYIGEGDTLLPDREREHAVAESILDAGALHV